MIPAPQLSAFRDELEKLGAHPYIHGGTALLGGGLAAYGATPYMFHQHERDVRDEHMGKMTRSIRRKRDGRRVLQLGGLVGGAAGLGALTPFAVEHGGRYLKRRFSGVPAHAAEQAAHAAAAARAATMDGLREGGRAAAEGVVGGAKDAYNANKANLKREAAEWGSHLKDETVEAAREAARAGVDEGVDHLHDLYNESKGALKNEGAEWADHLGEHAGQGARRGAFNRKPKPPKPPPPTPDDTPAGTGFFNRMFR